MVALFDMTVLQKKKRKKEKTVEGKEAKPYCMICCVESYGSCICSSLFAHASLDKTSGDPPKNGS